MIRINLYFHGIYQCLNMADHSHTNVVISGSARETLTLLHVNNKDADQPAHPRSLISALVVHCMEISSTQNYNSLHSLVVERLVWVFHGQKPRKHVFSRRGTFAHRIQTLKLFPALASIKTTFESFCTSQMHFCPQCL